MNQTPTKKIAQKSESSKVTPLSNKSQHLSPTIRRHYKQNKSLAFSSSRSFKSNELTQSYQHNNSSLILSLQFQDEAKQLFNKCKQKIEVIQTQGSQLEEIEAKILKKKTKKKKLKEKIQQLKSSLQSIKEQVQQTQINKQTIQKTTKNVSIKSEEINDKLSIMLIQLQTDKKETQELKISLKQQEQESNQLDQTLQNKKKQNESLNGYISFLKKKIADVNKEKEAIKQQTLSAVKCIQKLKNKLSNKVIYYIEQ